MRSEVIQSLEVSAYKIPTDGPESDGTIQWDSTTLVLVELESEGVTGVGYSYAAPATAYYIEHALREIVMQADIMDIPATWQAMISAIRNDGYCGIAAMAVAAIDNALWDLKAKVLGISLASLLGMERTSIPVYGSGGFTSYTIEKLQNQLGGWVEKGIKQVKMKIGREPEKDTERVKAAREAIGDDVQLFVDANGAYNIKQAVEKAWQFDGYGVSWFEEPVSSDNLEGLSFIRREVPSGMKVAAGEYGYNPVYFERIVHAGAVDVLQADATRCAVISGFLKAGNICDAHQLLFSSHCAPSLHLPAALAVPSFYTAEYFYDHARIEDLLFDGSPQPVNGALYPDLDKPGSGLTLKRKDAQRFRI